MAGELWTVNLGVVEYREAWALQERVRAARQADAIPDTLLLLEHPPVYTRGRRSQPGRARDGRGLVPRCRASTSSTSTAAACSPTTAPASSSATRSCASTDLMGYVRTMEQAIVTALATRASPARAGAPSDGPRLHRRLDGRAQDRLDRRAPLARGDHARLRGQRRQRPAALRMGRALRPARRAHDLGHARARPRRPPAVLPQAHGLPLRRGVRAPPAPGVGGAPGGRGRRARRCPPSATARSTGWCARWRADAPGG